jgi:hypothetical protein
MFSVKIPLLTSFIINGGDAILVGGQADPNSEPLHWQAMKPFGRML